MNKKRLSVILAIAAITPLALAACSGGGGGGNSDSDSTTLSILDYYNNEPDNTLVQTGLDACATELGVKIKRETVPGADLMTKVLQQASSKTLPDVLMLDNPDLQQVAATGALADLGDYGVTADGFAKGITDASSYEGKLYGLAPVVNTIAIFYNTDILSAAGITPPKTWDELKTAAKALTTGDQYGIAFSAPANYEGSWQFLPAMWTNGGDEKDLTSPEVAEALQLWVDLVDSGSASQSVVNWTQGDVKDQFVAGKAAMMVNGPWNIPALNEAPNVKWDVVQFPVNKAGQTPIAPLGGEVWTAPLTGNKDKQEKAAKFVECLSSDKNELAWAKARQMVPTKTALAAQFKEENPNLSAFVDQVANARSRTGELGEKWPDAATVIYEAIQLGITHQAPVADAFKQAENK
jgi:multiple sugar transport system substrate-binding protein